MPTPVEERAFLKPIAARPGDDGPRLIYADYLDESDDPADHARAEFIRVQLALARLPDDHPARPKLCERQGSLLEQHKDEWTRHLKGLAVGFQFRRGVIDAVTVEVDQFAESGAELFRRAPVRLVRFDNAAGRIDKLVSCPLLAKVRELVLCGSDLGQGGVNVLLRSPHLVGVESLDLSFNGLGDGAAALLADSPALPHLTALHLTANGLTGDRGLDELVSSPHLPRLRALDLSANLIGGHGVAALSGGAALRSLRLHNNKIGDKGCAVLAGSPLLLCVLAGGGRLDLRDNDIGCDGVGALARSPHLAAAVALDLRHNRVGDAAVFELVTSPHTGKLRKLFLGENQLSDAGAVALARSPLMCQLDLVDVARNKLTRRGIDELYKLRRDYRTLVPCDGNLPGVSGPREPRG